MTAISHDFWPAPVAASPISGAVRVPGSKSITNRALVLAALSEEQSTITNPLVARDTTLMMNALQAFGATFTSFDHCVEVTPTTSQNCGDVDIDCGLAGTVMRFLPALAGLHHGRFRFDGDTAARQRPMRPVVAALRDLGVAVDDVDFLPFMLRGTGNIRGGAISIDASASSQFVTALLLAAPRFESGLDLTSSTSKIPSLPHIDMTVRMLADHGVTVEASATESGLPRWRVEPAALRAVNRDVEPDLSNAMPFIAAAIVTNGSIEIAGIPAHSLQPVTAVVELLTALGCEIDRRPQSLRVTGPSQVRGIDWDMSDIGELVPTVAAICAFADTPSRLRGISHIRGHETDRIAALQEIFANLGGNLEPSDDGILITPTLLRGGVVPTFHDHRLATAGAIMGLHTPGVMVENIATTAKTMPDFPRLWAELVQGTSV